MFWKAGTESRIASETICWDDTLMGRLGGTFPALQAACLESKSWSRRPIALEGNSPANDG